MLLETNRLEHEFIMRQIHKSLFITFELCFYYFYWCRTDTFIFYLRFPPATVLKAKTKYV